MAKSFSASDFGKSIDFMIKEVDFKIFKFMGKNNEFIDIEKIYLILLNQFRTKQFLRRLIKDKNERRQSNRLY